MFWRLFRSKKPRPPLPDVRARVQGHGRPALHITARQPGARSHLGGVPRLYPGTAWPTAGGKPLGFLASLDLTEMQLALPIEWLPRPGALQFFYDLDSQPWGFEPKDRGKWLVRHIAGAETAPAPASSIETVAPVEPAPRVPVGFRRIVSYPSLERGDFGSPELTDEESEAYYELGVAEFLSEPQHQLGGFPGPIQGDEMELECQLASHGIYVGTPEGYRDPRATTLTPGAADWRLLAQFDSDDALDWMWGDAGRLYFWVREREARAGDFSNAWVVLQCS